MNGNSYCNTHQHQVVSTANILSEEYILMFMEEVMKKTFIAKFVAAAIFATVAFAGATEIIPSIPADKALELLMQGNSTFVNGTVPHLDAYAKIKRRTEVAGSQHPFAIIVACSDSRVPPELLFDKGLGEIFVVRVAGNIVGEHELGSIEYAAEHLGVKLVMVLGHERCGAVTSTYDAVAAGSVIDDGHHSNIDSLVKAIAPAVTETLEHATGTKAEVIEECIITNVNKVAEAIEEGSDLLKELVEGHELTIVKAKYDLDSGKVVLLSE